MTLSAVMLAMPMILAMCCAASFLACAAVMLSSLKKDKRRSAVRTTTMVNYMHGSDEQAQNKVTAVAATSGDWFCDDEFADAV